MSLAFGRQCKLRKRHEFQRVFDQGKRHPLSAFTLLSAMNGLEQCRLGLVVSRKVGPAVVRNKVKRRFREIFRLHQEDIPPGRDYVVVARAPAPRLPFDELERQFLKAAQALG